jgi:hypothetical protein
MYTEILYCVFRRSTSHLLLLFKALISGPQVLLIGHCIRSRTTLPIPATVRISFMIPDRPALTQSHIVTDVMTRSLLTNVRRPNSTHLNSISCEPPGQRISRLAIPTAKSLPLVVKTPPTVCGLFFLAATLFTPSVHCALAILHREPC